jgi:microcystin-dependent protein
MSTGYKGFTIPEYSDAADAPAAFEDLVDSGPIPRFTDSTARDSAITSPTEGQFCYLLSTGRLQRYDGSSWVTYQTTPTGVLAMFVDTSPPSGWLLCDGSEVSRTTYADLFAIMGTTYGNGNGSTTFNLPDFRQRFPLGKAASGTGANLGDTGGNINHTHSTPNHSHTMPQHSHNVDIGSFNTGADGGHFHTESPGTSPGAAGTGPYDIDPVGDHQHTVNPPNTSTTNVDPGNTNSGGGSTTGSGNPPYLVVTFIVKY